jgi:hypothetical protein
MSTAEVVERVVGSVVEAAPSTMLIPLVRVPAEPINPAGQASDAESFSVKDFDNDLPRRTWTDEELIAYAKHQAEQIRSLKRKLAVHVRRMGRALSLYRDRHLDHGDWQGFLASQGISGPSAWRAIQLYKRTKTETDVSDLGITEAYLKYGILREEASKKKTKSQPATGDELPKPAVATLQPNQPNDLTVVTPGPTNGPEPDDEAEEDSAADGQAPGDDDDTPTKEKMTPLKVMVIINRGLQWLEKNIPVIDWTKEDKAAHRERLREIAELAARLEPLLS